MLARCFTVAAVLVAVTSEVRADCPTNLEELPATGFLASATRELMEPVGPPRPEWYQVQPSEVAAAPDAPGVQVATTAVVPPPRVPWFEAQLTAAGGMRAETDLVAGTAAIGGQVLARRKSLTGCVSANLVDVRDGAVHATASGQVPMFFTGFSFGAAIDRNIRLPLATRAEFLRAPISRIAAQFSASFVDLDLRTREHNLRLMVVPFTFEQAVAKQDAESLALERHTMAADASMLRLVAADATGDGRVGIFNVQMSVIDSPLQAMQSPAQGFARFSPLSLEIRGEHWDWSLDGGVLSLAGPVDSGGKGYYRAMLRRHWEHASLDTTAERDAFIAANDQPAIEDRLAFGGSLENADGTRRGNASAFVARTAAWLDGATARRTGTRLVFTQQLGHGFSAIADGELAYTSGADLAAVEPMDVREGTARLLVSLAWQARVER